MVAAALAVFLAGSTGAAVGDAEAEAPVALLNLGPEEGERPLNPPSALPTPTPALTISELRRIKCAYLWARVAPGSYTKALCEFFVSEHERIGLSADWYYSFCNAAHASGLNPRMSFRKGTMWARGLMESPRGNPWLQPGEEARCR